MVVITGLVAFEMGAFQPPFKGEQKISHFRFGECRRDEKTRPEPRLLNDREVCDPRPGGVPAPGVRRPCAGIRRRRYCRWRRRRPSNRRGDTPTGAASASASAILHRWQQRQQAEEVGEEARYQQQEPASTSETLFTISAAGLSPAASFAASARRFSCPDCAPAKCRRRS